MANGDSGDLLLRVRAEVDDARQKLQSLESDVQRLKGESQGAIDLDTGETTKEFADLRAELDRMEAETRELVDQSRQLSEGLGGAGSSAEALTKRLAGLVGKSLAVAAAFGAGWTVGEKIRQKLNELGEAAGLGANAFDRLVQSATGMTALATALAGGTSQLAEATGGLVQSEDQLANMLRVVNAAGIEHNGTVKGLTASYHQAVEQFRSAREETAKGAAAFDTLRLSVAGVDVAQLESELGTAIAALEHMRRENIKLSDDSLPKLVEHIAQLQDEADLAGDTIDEALTARLRELGGASAQTAVRLRELRLNLSALGLEGVGAIDEVLGRILNYEAAVSGAAEGTRNLGRVTSEQAAFIVAEIDKVIESIALLPAEQRAGFDVWQATLQEIRAEYVGLGDDTESVTVDTRELARVIAEEVPAAASAAVAAIQSLRAELEQELKANIQVEEGAGENLQGVQDRITELQNQPVLSLEESEELADLQGQLADLQGTLSDARQETQLTQIQLANLGTTGAQVGEVVAGGVAQVLDVMELVNQATGNTADSMEQVGDEAQDAGQQLGGAASGAQTFSGAMGNLDQVLEGFEERDIDGQTLLIADALKKAEEGATGAGEGLSKMGEAAEGLPEKLKGLGESAEDVNLIADSVARLHTALAGAHTECEGLQQCLAELGSL